MPLPRGRFLIGASVASLPLGWTAAASQSLTRLTIGAPPIDPDIPPYVGIRAGIYRRYGLDVEIQQMSSGSAIAAAVAGGALSMGGSSLVGLIIAHTKGIPFQIIAPANIYLSEKPAELLLVRKDSPIRSASELKGKTIASPSIGDLLSSSSLAWIDQNGGDSKSVRQIELSPSAMPAALDAARVDAIALAEPQLAEALQSGNVRVLGKPYDTVAKRFLVSAQFATASFITANRSAVERFVRAQREANAFANAHPDQTAPWLADFAKVDLDTIKRSNRAIFGDTMRVADVQVVVDAATRFKIIDRSFDARELISDVAFVR